MKKCNNCQKNLNSANLTNYETEKDLLICVQCYFKQKEKYKNYSVSHYFSKKKKWKN